MTVASLAEFASLTERLIRAPIERVDRVEEGFVKRTYRVETRAGTYAVYLADDPDGAANLRRSAAAARYARETADLPVPAVVAAAFEPDWGVVVADWAPGEHLTAAAPLGVRRAAARSIGQQVARMHANSAFPAFGRLDSPDGRSLVVETDAPERDWATWLADDLHAALDRLADTGFATAVPPARAFVAERVPRLPGADPVLDHDDLEPRNVLFADDAVTAVVDWDGTSATAPGYGLHDATERFRDWFAGTDGDAVRDALLAGYEAVRDLPRDFVAHGDCYRVAWAIHHLDTVRSVHHGDPPPDEVDRHLPTLTSRLPE